MRSFLIQKIRFAACVLPFFLIVSCSNDPSSVFRSDRSGALGIFGATASLDGQLVPRTPQKTPSQLYSEVNVKKDIIPSGRHARKYKRSMSPRYITIHSTQNYARGADALRHSIALKNGKLRAPKRRGGNRIGYLVWHYTVDMHRAVQHLPTNEQGEHADFSGPGNRYSIGIEMCENRGNSREATLERTAKLCAYFMHKYNIPLRQVVPHQHWPRKGLKEPHKNCPHYLMDNGKPGAKWQWFLRKIDKHYKSISNPVLTPPAPSQPSQYASNTQSSRASSSNTRTTTQVQSTRPPVVKKTPSPTTKYHTVVRGDTLYGIARKYGTSVATIKKTNSLRSDTIRVGQRLRVQ